jgi:hypothetical protein
MAAELILLTEMSWRIPGRTKVVAKQIVDSKVRRRMDEQSPLDVVQHVLGDEFAETSAVRLKLEADGLAPRIPERCPIVPGFYPAEKRL